MTIRRISIILLAVVAAGCGSRKAEHFAALPFPDVMPPAMISGQQEAAEYMAEHWWDNITDPARTYPCDSSLVSGVKKEDIEQKFANWTSFLDMTGPAHAAKSVSRLYERAAACERKDTSSNVFETFENLVGRYLYDPNSPLRNEDLYGVYAEKMASCSLLDDAQKDKYAYDARMCALNKVGTKAADFRFADKRGRIRTLYGIDSELILLFFSNPGCNACMEIIKVLNSDPKISSMIADGTMSVLNIYIDEDLEAWRSYMPIYPENWYNGFDPDFVIRGETIYNVRAIPSLYLLDKDKKVIIKDIPEQKLFAYLENIEY